MEYGLHGSTAAPWLGRVLTMMLFAALGWADWHLTYTEGCDVLDVQGGAKVGARRVGAHHRCQPAHKHLTLNTAVLQATHAGMQAQGSIYACVLLAGRCHRAKQARLEMHAH